MVSAFRELVQRGLGVFQSQDALEDAQARLRFQQGRRRAIVIHERVAKGSDASREMMSADALEFGPQSLERIAFCRSRGAQAAHDEVLQRLLKVLDDLQNLGKLCHDLSTKDTKITKGEGIWEALFVFFVPFVDSFHIA
jgi:hypothetical protein